MNYFYNGAGRPRPTLAPNKRAKTNVIKRKTNASPFKTRRLNSEKTNLVLKRRPRGYNSRLSSIYDLDNSLLRNLSSYRLTKQYSESGKLITDLRYTHNICPNNFVCLPDLIGTCTDKSCAYQHKSHYIMNDMDKLADILSYRPSLTGFKYDPNLALEENVKLCRFKLKLYAARLLSKNPDKKVEMIAQSLMKYIRFNKSDQDLLTSVRDLRIGAER